MSPHEAALVGAVVAAIADGRYAIIYHEAGPCDPAYYTLEDEREKLPTVVYDHARREPVARVGGVSIVDTDLVDQIDQAMEARKAEVAQNTTAAMLAAREAAIAAELVKFGAER